MSLSQALFKSYIFLNNYIIYISDSGLFDLYSIAHSVLRPLSK